MNIIIYSKDISSDGGGRFSTDTTIKYLKEKHHIRLSTNVKELIKQIKNSKPDVIHHQNISDIIKVTKISKKYNIKLIVTINNLISCMVGLHVIPTKDYKTLCNKCNPIKGLYCTIIQKNTHTKKYKTKSILLYPFRYIYRNLRIQALNKANKIIAISPTLKKLLIINGVKSNIEIIPQPIDEEFFKIKSTPNNNILYIGAGEPFKGIHLLINAFNILINRYPKLILKIAGPIDNKHNIDINKYNKNIEFLGALSKEKIKELYSTSKALIFPSLWQEAFGRAWAEAATSGIPVIGIKNRAGVSDYLIDNVSCLLAENNPVDLAKKIEQLLLNQSLCNKLIINAKEFAKQQLIATEVIKRIEQVYLT